LGQSCKSETLGQTLKAQFQPENIKTMVKS
jgi:hypothetical protein